MSYRGKSILLLCLILAGCSTPPMPRQRDVTIMPDTTGGVVETAPEVSPEQVVVAAPVQLPPPPATVPTQAPPSVTVVPATPRPVMPTWMTLDNWARLNGLNAPRRSSAEMGPLYFLSASNGNLMLRPGSQLARWNGAEFHLGFAPQMSGGQLLVHALDLQKNLEPLFHPSETMAKSNPVIVIDPGHGGVDTGATNIYNGWPEKEFTLDWARRVEKLLTARGCTVYLTRTSDVGLVVSNRVTFAEQRKADLFVSLHFNSFSNRDEAGLETYCLTPAGMPSTLTRGYKDNSALTFPNNAYDLQNLQFAFQFHNALLKVNGHKDRGVRRARFLGVLQGQHRPAVLVEGGFLSNPGEGRRIADPAYRQQLAEALARAILENSGAELKLASQSPAPPASAKPDGKIN